MLDPAKLVTLRTVVELRSFSAAAAVLHLTQPGVSRQVALLERQLGTPLVVRTRGRLEPTPAGALLLEHAEIALDRLVLAEARVRALAASDTGTVRLGSFFSALVHLSAEVGAVLAEQHPGLRIADDLVDATAAYAKLARGDLDLALVFSHPLQHRPAPHGIRLERLFDDPVRVLLPAVHPLAHRPDLAVRDLAAETWIRAIDGGAADLLDQVLAQHRIEPELLLAGHGDEPVEIQALVAAGRGVTLSYDLTVVVSRHDLVLLPIRDHIPPRTIAVATADGPLAPTSAAVLDAMRTLRRGE
jgi:DNA-binding transcriptional LysR family regulator